MEFGTNLENKLRGSILSALKEARNRLTFRV
jgi:hypothetical protein